MLRMIVRSDRIVNELGDAYSTVIRSKFNRLQLEDGFVKHAFAVTF